MAGGTVTIAGGNVIHTFTSTGYLAPLDFVGNSLRFRSSATAYLSRTPSVASNTQTWTWSGWLKYGSLTTAREIFGAGANGSNWTGIDLRADARVQLFSSTSGSAVGSIVWSPNVYRDPAAWYHFTIVCDTTNATQTSRFRFYVNGVQVTGISSTPGENTYPAQNATTNVNTTVIHNIGRKPYNTSEYYDGYLAEVNFIDGQALLPTSFGTFNSLGVWQPITYGGSYGTNGFYLPFPNSATGTAVSSSYLVVAGGAGGGGGDSTAAGSAGAGGGAGGLLTGTTSLSLSASYVVTVGAGGAAGGTAAKGSDGTVSTINAITSTGGGGGGSGYADGFPSRATGNAGGSGGGTGGITGGTSPAGGAGTAGQGFAGGGSQANRAGAGGGGASAVGIAGVSNSSPGGTGGAGTASSISGSSVTYGGGGGGGGWGTPGTPVGNSTGGAGGGGFGGGSNGSGTAGQAGTANLGGGGGGGGSWNTGTSAAGGAGGSGVVILSYAGPQRYTGGTVTTSGGNTIHTFTSSGVLTSIFNDFSPQGNNWTGNNFDVTNTTATSYDSMTDVPTLTSATAANYATWNPLTAGGLVTFSEANLKALSTSASAPFNIETTMKTATTGKWYAEVTVAAGASNPVVGIGNNPATSASNTDQFAGYRTNATYVTSGMGASSSGTPATFTTNDVIGIAYDADAGTLVFYKNGTLQSGGFTGITAGNYSFIVRKDSASGDGGFLNCGQRPFSYTVPSGFVRLNAFNI
jgi:hypothetical protein